MGTEEVLYVTRRLSWSADTDRYPSIDDFK